MGADIRPVSYHSRVNSNESKELVASPNKNYSTERCKTEILVEMKNGHQKQAFDPFEERVVEKPTTNCETLIHLLKSCLGCGILTMPFAFKYIGLVPGIFGTIFVGFITAYCIYMLVNSAHTLYYRTRRTKMSYGEVLEAALLTGPKWARPLAKWSRYFVLTSIFFTYLGGITLYIIIISDSFRGVIHYHFPEVFAEPTWFTILLLIPLIPLGWIPNLKYLAPISLFSNICMGSGIGITMYEILTNVTEVNRDEHLVFGPEVTIDGITNFITMTIFSMAAIGVMMPLENNMKNPKNFVGICGVLNQGMFGITVICIVVGFLGYFKFGNTVADVITKNLSQTSISSQVAQVLIGLAVVGTTALGFSVLVEIGWDGIKNYCEKAPKISNYVMRTALIVLMVSIAVLLPAIKPYVNLLSALCFATLGFLIPIVIDTLTRWETGFGKYHWIAIKNCLLFVFSLLVVGFGTKEGIVSLIDELKKKKL